MTRDSPPPWWNFAAVVIALIAVAAGYAFVNASFDTPPAAENYRQQRALREFLRGALLLVAFVAPLVSLAVGIIGRAVPGVLAALLAGAFAMFWVPANMRACCGGDEASAIGILRTINSAQQAYSSTCASSKGFADSLEALAKPPVPGSTAYIPAGLEHGFWRGYKVTMQIPEGSAVDFVACNGTRVVAAYFVEAHPIEADGNRRNFATDERGTIYQTVGGPPIKPGMAGADVVQ